MRYFSMFSGIGGFELGIEQSYHKLFQKQGREDTISCQKRKSGKHPEMSFREPEPICNGVRTGSDRDAKCESEEKVASHSERDQPISQGTQERDDQQKDSERTESASDTGGTLFQDGQQQGNSFSSIMGSAKDNIGLGQPIRCAGDGILRKRDGIRDDKACLQSGEGKSHPEEWECVGFSEIDKYAIQCYQSHFPGHKNYGNARDIDPMAIPDFDMLCGGFPCQAFSIAGKRMGFEDTRGTLFFEIARIVKVKRPRILFLENVKGLLNHDEGRTFATILATLDELGYNAEWEVLNSKNFGVPQNRERVFIIGHLRGAGGQQIFPIGKDGSRDNEEQFSRQETDEENRQSIENPKDRGGCEVHNDIAIGVGVYDDYNGNFRKDGLIGTVTPNFSSEASRNGTKLFLGAAYRTRSYCGQEGHIETRKDDLANQLTTATKDSMVMNCLTEAQGRQGSSSEFKSACSRIGSATGQIRRLTPVECERLQGFPDGWTSMLSDTQRYKTLGNAVTVNVIEAIAGRLANVFP
jgi:DNA (cytosine-5)-methyltransferase 1